MTLLPHTVTLYNVEITTDKTTFEETRENHITVLEGVFLDTHNAARTAKNGEVGADSISLHIPFSVAATDGVTGVEKTFLPPFQYWAAADKGEVWTLGTGKNCFFIKGVVVEPEASYESLENTYEDVYQINSIKKRDFGSLELQHWEVAGA